MLSEIATIGARRYARGIARSTATTAAAIGHATCRNAVAPNRWWHSPSTGRAE